MLLPINAILPLVFVGLVLTGERANRTASVKVQANSAEEVLSILKIIDDKLPGIKITTGVRPSDHTGGGRFDYDFYAYCLVTYELTPNGRPKPTQRNAVLAFKEGREL